MRSFDRIHRGITIVDAPPAAPVRRSSRGKIVAILVLIVVGLIAAALYVNRDRPVAEAHGGSFTVKDVRGRTVTIKGPVKHIAIDDSRYLVALGLIHPDPASLLAAWPKDINRLGPETYQQFLAKSPKLDSLPKIASSAGAFDSESLLAAHPDVAIISLESGVTDAQIAQVEAAGIPVVVVDFFVKPLTNLEPSLLLLGQLTGRDEQAKAFVTFRAEHMKRISERLATFDMAAPPRVFLEAHAGMNADCCNSPGNGNIGDYLNFVGGHNIGADVISQAFGKLNLEYVISQDPAVYIATGGPHLKKAGGLVLGAGVDEAAARASLAKVASRQGISGLSAVKNGRTYGFSHQLINSPLDIVAIETFAKWVHPTHFADVDPAATLAEINSRFLAVPYQGSYWVELKPTAPPPAGAKTP